ncbi:hypothetical protein BZA77DRAFT_354325 [Pyronema omphalodes]|nr:hypothetical protein BZA77DRAFT_354325 [Pyronema omphalodes]
MQFSIVAASMIFAASAFSAAVPLEKASALDHPAGSSNATNHFGKRDPQWDCYATGCNEKCKQDYQVKNAAYCSPTNHGVKAVCCRK